MKNLKVIFILAVSLIICISDVFAANITIYDNRVSGGSGTWYNRGIDPGEDQEVEPGMIALQSWDLEGFFLEGNLLSMSGGFDFKDGNQGYTSGDIFIDVTGDATYGGPGGSAGSSLRNGYDYAIKFIFGSWEYYAYAIIPEGQLNDVLDYNSFESSPWRYNPGTESFINSGNFSYSSWNDAQGTHYTLSNIDLSFLPAGTSFISHFTMGCGNDNLMGAGRTEVPEPATLILLGLGLVGISLSVRKLRK